MQVFLAWSSSECPPAQCRALSKVSVPGSPRLAAVGGAAVFLADLSVCWSMAVLKNIARRVGAGR